MRKSLKQLQARLVSVARSSLAPKRSSPDELLGELFQDVQIRRIFSDSIAFVDMLPAHTLRKILKAYHAERQQPNFDLEDFVHEHFKGLLPVAQEQYITNPSHTAEQHIEDLWPVLTRDIPGNSGSLIGLPYPYIVAGGRFSAQFYWDSYFIMLGLAASSHWDMVENMTKNCAFLIHKVGFVPNGNRTYYCSRSQPPMFALMVRLLAHKKGKLTLVKYLPALLAEYRFWMKGRDNLRKGGKIASRRVVRMPSGAVLNRYYDNKSTPRPEGYKEDVDNALQAPSRVPSRVYLDLRAGAESGWDYSSRWLRPGEPFASIHTTDIIPVDLNCLLYLLEQAIADGYAVLRQRRLSAYYQRAALKRREAIQTYCWDEAKGFFVDYDFVAGAKSSILSLASAYALFAGVAEPNQAKKVASLLQKKFLQPGGLVTTLIDSGQQWDWPNGWAPLQWLAIKGLQAYGHYDLAKEIKQRWVGAVTNRYKKEGKLVEKYNVVDQDAPQRNGEYPLQDGFGWTNGVLLALLHEDALR